MEVDNCFLKCVYYYLLSFNRKLAVYMSFKYILITSEPRIFMTWMLNCFDCGRDSKSFSDSCFLSKMNLDVFHWQIISVLHFSEMSDIKDDKMDDDSKYGGCEGPDAMYVKLISSDGHEFIVKREHALTSGTIKAMLSGPGNLNDCLHYIHFSNSN